MSENEKIEKNDSNERETIKENDNKTYKKQEENKIENDIADKVEEKDYNETDNQKKANNSPVNNKNNEKKDVKENEKEKIEEEEKSLEDKISELEREKLENKILELNDEINEINEERDRLLKRLQRLQADFSNYRKRMEKEKFALSLEAKIELINEILPVIDNFERALNTESEEEDLREGVEMIYRQLINTLEQEGLKEIPALGEKFNHKYHEAIMQVEDKEKQSGHIVEVMQKGYMLNDKVIRPAMVKVAK